MEILSRRQRAERAGFTLVDVCVATLILAIAMGTLIGSVFSAMRLEQANEETAAASQAMRSILEDMYALDFGELYATYNADPLDDPEAGAANRAALLVDHPLLVAGGKAPVIEILLPDAGGELREDSKLPEFGLPRDLNGDGKTDALNHAGDYELLPMTIRLEWESGSGQHALEMSTLLRRR